MKRRWVRDLSCFLVVSALVLVVFGRKMFVVGPKILAPRSDAVSHVRSSMVAERPSVDKSRKRVGLAETGQLRKEALELLGGVEEFTNVGDMLAETSRLSSIFREWGRGDFEVARSFLETEDAARKFLDPDRRFSDELYLAALIGYSGTDAIHAWELFLETQDYSENELILNPGKQPYAHEVASEQIIRAMFRKSAKTALETLREIDPEYRFLVAPSLRGIMAESLDGQLRLELLREFLDSPPYGSRMEAGIVLAGLAEHDPQFAWEYLQQWSKTQELISSDQPELHFGAELIEYWSRRQPERALRFVASMEVGEAQSVFLLGFLSSQDLFRPEVVVEALEMESLRYFQKAIRPDIFVQGLNKDTPWPLTEENVQVPKDVRLANLKKAVMASDLPGSLKGKFLSAIESEYSK